MRCRGTFQVVGGHHRVRELSSFVWRDVRASCARSNDPEAHDQPGVHGRYFLVFFFDQLFIAPAAAHALKSAEALALLPGPPGGMLPPNQLRHDPAPARDELVPRM